MTRRNTPAAWLVLAMTAALALPSMAGAEGRGHGDGEGHGRALGHFRGNEGGGGERREFRGGGENRGGGGQRFQESGRVRDFFVDRQNARGGFDRGNARGDAGRWQTQQPRGGWNGDRGGAQYRSTPDSRWVGGWNIRREPAVRYRGGYGGGYAGGYNSYPGHRYRGGYYGRPYYTRYYTSGFYRPRFIRRSGFSIGFGVSSWPSSGCGYYDPYCGTRFRCLDDYYDHCCEYDHPDAILMIDVASGAPLATCGYHDGDWIIDDCWDE